MEIIATKLDVKVLALEKAIAVRQPDWDRWEIVRAAEAFEEFLMDGFDTQKEAEA